MNQISGGLFYNFNDATTDQNIFGMSLLRLSAESTNTQIYFAILHSKLKMILSSRNNCSLKSSFKLLCLQKSNRAWKRRALLLWRNSEGIYSLKRIPKWNYTK